MLILLLALACKPAPEADPIPHVPELPNGGCGAAEYAWLPTDAPGAEMGEVLAWEPVDEASLPASAFNALLGQAGLERLGPVPYGTRVFRVRYRTQDRGEAVEATGLIAFPDASEPVEVPSLGWMHPTVGFSDACAPSGGGVEDLLGATLLAAFGFAVAAPDYLGMAGWGEPSGRLHPYVVPEPTAVAALDGLRALHHFQARGFDPSVQATATSDVVLWGASEGGFAALWADRYAEGYAPELDVLAVVAAVPPTELVGIAKAGVAEPIDATVGLAAVLGASWDWYGGAEVAPLSLVFTNEAPNFVADNLLDSMQADCGGGDVMDGIDTVEALFTPALVSAVEGGNLDEIAPFGCYLEAGNLASSPIPRGSSAPVFVQVSERDQLVVGPAVRADIPRLCEAGYAIDYLECAGASHVSGAVESLPLQIRWVQDRVAGVPVGETCVISEPVDCAALAEQAR